MYLSKLTSGRFLFIWISEFILVFLTATLVIAIRLKLDYGVVTTYDPHFVKITALSVTYILAFYYFDLYTPDTYRPSRTMFIRLTSATLLATVALFSLYFMFPSISVWRGILLANTILLPSFIVLWRWLFSRANSIELPSKRVIILGSGELAQKIGKYIYTTQELGIKLVGFIDDDPTKWGVPVVNPGVIGGYGDIARLTDKEKIDLIIIALPDRRSKLPMSALLDCKLKGIQVEEGETFNERVTGNIPLDHLKPSWMVFSSGFKSLRTRKIMKRVIDLILAIVCLILAWPLMLLTALAVKLDSKGPAILSQARVGERGREFKIYKFRSMREDAEAGTGPVWAGTEDNRITRVGAIIRKIRFDELPQLVNVLKGDMSFVGPRPERLFFVNKLKDIIPYYEIRTIVKPGITGWAQIMYPYGATTQDAIEKLQYDIYYIKNMSPLLDLLIFFWTIKVMLTGKGAR